LDIAAGRSLAAASSLLALVRSCLSPGGYASPPALFGPVCLAVAVGWALVRAPDPGGAVQAVR
jgi:hypothetical protein